MVLASVLSFVFITSALTFASEEEVIRTQGIVMGMDLQKNTLIVNERTFIWDPKTILYDEKGSPMTCDQLRANTWVYIEGMREGAQKRVRIEKIHILPKYIQEKEKHLYPFIH